MKTILIPLAAFAVTVTGASAFSPEILREAGLTNTQIAAFEEAKELKEAGDKEGARDVLIAAGVDEEVIKQVREAMREHADAVREAIEANDYDAFLAAAAGSPLADIIDSKSEFDRLVEAHELMKSGDKEEAKDIFDELGLTSPLFLKRWNDKADHPFLSKLDEEQREEFRAAWKEGDRERMQEILKEAGIDASSNWKDMKDKERGGFGWWQGKGHDQEHKSHDHN